ncbi:broad specificity phosphatase PhoE [Microbacterium testaceum]|uniref:histidine phosphatase family protein n=1 Tax=Microbacterium TaxID=33882 RepID=UPI001AE38342|nr:MULTISPECIES: histidine phosphatase family protein [Microbacterium]MDQ1111591.1 broad specificity phosphatase PhoE [Microbacterium testaceum]MDR6097874.1 broad specificity phosphatase PhoE [Microbacterium sp. SORGH_AS_0454]
MAVTRLWLVRHGESEGNVAASRAEREGSPTIDLDTRDADVPLSPTGEEQARALRSWWEQEGSSIDEYWVSPYLRARQTLALAVDEAALTGRTRVDERLRDRELGILDLLTARGVREFHPEEAARRRHLGKFYHRPPGGESWADVALRLRSFLGENLDRPADTVLLVAHDAVVMLILAILLPLDEAELLAFAAENTVRNASVTELVRGDTGWELTTFSSVEHLAVEGADITVHSGEDDVAPR